MSMYSCTVLILMILLYELFNLTSTVIIKGVIRLKCHEEETLL